MLSYRLKNITFTSKTFTTKVRPRPESADQPQLLPFRRRLPAPHRSRHRMAGIAQSPHHASWYTILFGARDVDTRGRRCYSSYVEVAYPFTVKTIDLKTGVGAAPWKTAGEGGAKGFAVKNVFINAGKLWAVKSMGSFRIGLFAHLSWCPLKRT